MALARSKQSVSACRVFFIFFFAYEHRLFLTKIEISRHQNPLLMGNKCLPKLHTVTDLEYPQLFLLSDATSY